MVMPGKHMAVAVCLSFEADDRATFDTAGEGAWQRFTAITAEAREVPQSVFIEMQLPLDTALRLDHDGQAVAQAQQRWTARGLRVTGELRRSHADWAGVPLALRVGDPGSYAGRRCGARVWVSFPLSEVPRLCPESTTGSCWVTCDHIACERR